MAAVDHGLNEAVDGLPFLLRDLRERVSVAELFVQLVLRQPEVGSRGLESREPIRANAVPRRGQAVKAPEAAEEERRLAGSIRSSSSAPCSSVSRACSTASSTRFFNALPERLLERARLDAELGRSVVDYRLTSSLEDMTCDAPMPRSRPSATTSASAATPSRDELDPSCVFPCRR